MSAFITYITLARPLALEPDLLREAVVGAAGGVFSDIKVQKAENTGVSPYLIILDGIALTVMQFGLPLPDDAYTKALRRNLIWADALPVMIAAKGHVIVAALNKPSAHADILKTAKAVTLLAAAVTKSASGTAVVWSEGQAMTSPKDFIAAARNIQNGKTPVTQWSSMLFEQLPSGLNGKKQLAVMTDGLLPFVGREIELRSSLPPHEAAKRVLGLCQYVMELGLVIKDGDTVGLKEGEEFRASYLNQGFRPELPVIQINQNPVLLSA